MSYQKEREEFISILTAELSSCTTGQIVELAGLLMRAANTIQREACLQCSSEAADRDRVPCPGAKKAGECLCDYDEATKQHERVPRTQVRELRAQQRISKLCEPFGLSPIFQGDPRGACVKLKVPSGKTNDWGKTGVCVPTRNY